MTDALARLSVALASRYRIERELGTGGVATVYRPEWSLSGNRMYFTIDQRESDVWVMEVARR